MLIILCILVIVLALVHFTIEYSVAPKKKTSVLDNVQSVTKKLEKLPTDEINEVIKPIQLPATECNGENLFEKFLNTHEERVDTTYRSQDSIEVQTRSLEPPGKSEMRAERDGYSST